MARINHPQRCVGCRLHPPECICDVIQTETERLKDLVRTRVVLVIHSKEMSRSTNSGFLGARLLPDCDMRVRGAKDQAVALDDLCSPDVEPVLLYPAPDAKILTAEHAHTDQAHGRLVLVVPDGSWRQAGSMVRRDPVLAQMKRVVLPPGGPVAYRLRTAPRPGALCTLDAIARALGLLEGPVTGPIVQRALETALDAQTQATLRMRGRA